MAGDGTSKSAASRRFVALSAERLAKWMASDLSKLDLLIIQINRASILATTWCWSPPSASMATAISIRSAWSKRGDQNTAVLQALIDNLIERGLDPDGLSAVHHRRRQGAEQSHPPHLQRPHPDPAVPNP